MYSIYFHLVRKIKNKIYIFYIKYLKKHLRLSSKPFVSGDSFRKLSDFVLDETSTFNPVNVSDGDLIFVKTDYIELFFKSYYSKIKKKFILITHNSDINITLAHTENNLDNIIAWYAQNINFDVNNHQKFYPVPIGLENRNWFKNGNTANFNIKIVKDPMKIFCGFSLNTNSSRIHIMKDIINHENIYIHRHSNHKEYIKELSRSKFSICPEGNGLDTHRFWESLILETVPIVLKTEFINNFKDHQIPILVLENWNDLLEFDYENLNEIYTNFHKKLTAGKYNNLEYWENIIKES